jgi:hypothetical protein
LFTVLVGEVTEARTEFAPKTTAEPMLRILTANGKHRLVHLTDIERLLSSTKTGQLVPDNVTLRIRGDRTWYEQPHIKLMNDVVNAYCLGT